MKYFTKKIYLLLFLIIALLVDHKTFGKENRVLYTKDNITNYFSGTVAFDKSQNTRAFRYLSETQSLINKHSNYNKNFVRTLILLNKFEEAFVFSQNIWSKDEFYFEVDLLLGLQNLIKKNYSYSEKHFMRIRKNSKNNLYFEDFLGSILMSWTKAYTNNEKESFDILNEITEEYDGIKQIQNSFLQCFFDTSEVEISYKRLVRNKDYNFSRYNFFLANYLIFKNKNIEAKKLIENAAKKNNSQLLIKQIKNFITNNNNSKIKIFFNCKNPNDALAEIFYLIANIYSANNDYKLSNFYLNISLFLNSKFTPNKILLAENLFSQKKNKLSKKIFNSLKSIGSVYSWHSSLNIAMISSSKDKKPSLISNLQKDFDALSNPDYENYYELANFYNNNEYYEESIKYYSLALQKIKQNHVLIPKILERRGTSYEKLHNWDRAEEDLVKSLEILPDQPYVLNYLAYSWIERKKNIDEAIEMLERAVKMRKNDGYIIDSLGWGYYKKKNYLYAEKYLQKAVEIFPLDPIINDHYADTLWMLNKNIQAIYFWKHVLNLDETEPDLIDKISKKIIFGINNNL